MPAIPDRALKILADLAPNALPEPFGTLIRIIRDALAQNEGTSLTINAFERADLFLAIQLLQVRLQAVNYGLSDQEMTEQLRISRQLIDGMKREKVSEPSADAEQVMALAISDRIRRHQEQLTNIALGGSPTPSLKHTIESFFRSEEHLIRCLREIAAAAKAVESTILILPSFPRMAEEMRTNICQRLKLLANRLYSELNDVQESRIYIDDQRRPRFPKLLIADDLLHPDLEVSDEIIDSVRGAIGPYHSICLQIIPTKTSLSLQCWWWMCDDKEATSLTEEIRIPRNRLNRGNADHVLTSFAQLMMATVCDMMSLLGMDGVSFLLPGLGASPPEYQRSAQTLAHMRQGIADGCQILPWGRDPQPFSEYVAGYVEDKLIEGGIPHGPRSLIGQWEFLAFKSDQSPAICIVAFAERSIATSNVLCYRTDKEYHLPEIWAEEHWRRITEEAANLLEAEPHRYVEISGLDLRDPIGHIQEKLRA